MTSAQLIEVVVSSVTPKADGIATWEFRDPEGKELPPFTAGAHIDLHLSNGLNRSYSLCNSQDDRDRYVVGINKDANSRGGSKFIHEALKVGDRVSISPPRNHFPLEENAPKVVLIAGGIGITPMWSMIQRLESLGREWELHYSTRLSSMCAFFDELSALESAKPGRVHFNFDGEPGGKMTNLRAVMAGVQKDAHLYCCGPVPMLKAYEEAGEALGWPSSQVHLEYFSAKEEAALDGGFTVICSKSGEELAIAPGQTILDALLDAGLEIEYSCFEGVCGTCEVRVLEGTPDHRDSVLSPEQKAANDRMFVCCSGSRTPRLVLDI